MREHTLNTRETLLYSDETGGGVIGKEQGRMIGRVNGLEKGERR